MDSSGWYLIFGVLYVILFILIYRYELLKYSENFPYKRVRKKGFGKRFLTGLLGGIHYAFFVGTYNHKKYNTQVFTPKTLECYVAGSFAGLLLLGHLLVTLYILGISVILGIVVLIIPFALNFISILIDRKMLA